MPITIDFGDGSTQSPDSNDEERTKKGKYKKVSYAKPRYEFVCRKINKVNHKKKLGRPRLRKRKCVHMDYNEETDNDSGEDEVEEEQDDDEQDEAEDNVQEDEVEENIEEDEVEVNVDNEQTDNEVEDLGENDLEEDSNWEEEEEAQIVDEAEESTELESSDAIEEDEGCINEEEEVELNVDLQDDEDEGSHYVKKDLNANKRKGRKKFQEKRLYIRASKKNFYSIMNNLSSKQKADIKQLGFGSLIKFSIMNVPTRLAYYVLEKFSAKDSILEVNGNLVLVNKERVHDVFGIPIGGKKIPYCPQVDFSEKIVKNRRKQCHTGRFTLKDLMREMEDQKTGGMLFKQKFLVFFVTTMVEGIKCNTVNQKFLPYITKINEARGFDWCDFLLICLKETKRGWLKSKESVDEKAEFNGPIMFLLILYAHEARKPENFQFPLFKNWDLESLKEIEKEISRNGEFEKVTEEIKMVPVPHEVKRKRASERLLERKKMILEQKKGLEDFVDEQDDTRKKSEGVQNEASQKHSQGEEFEFHGCNPFVETQSLEDMNFFRVETKIQVIRRKIQDRMHMRETLNKELVKLFHNGLRIRPYDDEILHLKQIFEENITMEEFYNFLPEDEFGEEECFGTKKGLRETVFEKGECSNPRQKDVTGLDENFEGEIDNIAIQKQDQVQNKTVKSSSKEDQALAGKTKRIEGVRECLKQKNQNPLEDIQHKQEKQDNKQGCQSKAVESTVDKVGDEQHSMRKKTNRIEVDRESLKEKYHNSPEAIEHKQGNQDDKQGSQSKAVESSFQKVGDEGHGIGGKSTRNELDCDGLMDKIQNATESDQRNLDKNKVDRIEADRKIGEKSIESSVDKVEDADHKIGEKNPAEANQGNQDKMKVDQRRKIDQILNKLNSKRTILEVNGSEIKKKSGVHKKKKVDPFLPSFDLGFDSPDSVEDGESHGQGDLDETPKVKDLKSLPDTEKVSQNISQMPFLKVSNSEFSDKGDPIFKMDQFKTLRVVFETMRPGHMIIAQVIDVWTSILNYEETKRDMKGTVRLFCHTNIISPNMIQFDSSADKQMQYEIVFSNRIADILKQYGLKSLKNVDLVFFPMVSQVSYYVIVFKLKTKEIHFLDSRIHESDDVDLIYGTYQRRLRELFDTYMAIEEAVVTNFVQSKPVIVRMKWRTKRNFNDSGIFAMRHIEYVTKMLTSDLNELHKNVTTEVEDYFKIPEFMRRILESKSSAEIDDRVKQTMEIVITQ
uniref:kinesin-related protein 4-like n=1 Tax=Erigeron canadensis TaxID=72917 RepID=UPI001CB99143|nr:kinesin-related protein 4-like [Erigeron canadensis]